ncbi:MAG: hypothetical protein U5L45_07795 [Saprospiraceae bacterium]|nr:hypothetical protein [Saprospiraceae bacterium]
MVHFSGKAQKINHIPLLPASEASAWLSNYDYDRYKNKTSCVNV